jgi:hypothetical protein
MKTATRRHILALGGRVAWHAVAVAVGFVLMVVGLALGVTMVLLPVGLVVGIVGVLLFVVGVFARGERS